MCEKFHQLLAVGRWFPLGTPVSSTRKLISSSFHRLDMTLAVAEALNPNKPNLDMTLAVAEALNPNKPNLDMTLAVAEALNPNKPNLDMTLAVAEALNPNKPMIPPNDVTLTDSNVQLLYLDACNVPL